MPQSTEGHYLFQIPVDGFFHLHQSDEPFTEGYIKQMLDQFNIGGAMLAEGVPNPARIEVQLDEVEVDVWFTPDPSLPVNPRARQLVADTFGWHMVFSGCVVVDGLSEQTAMRFIEEYG